MEGGCRVESGGRVTGGGRGEESIEERYRELKK